MFRAREGGGGRVGGGRDKVLAKTARRRRGGGVPRSYNTFLALMLKEGPSNKLCRTTGENVGGEGGGDHKNKKSITENSKTM